MATAPSFAATVNLGAALLSAGAETSLQVPTKTATIVTAGSNGTRIDEIVVHMTSTGAGGIVATTVAGLVYVFLYDGSTYHLYDTLTVTAVTASSTAAPFRTNKTYTNLVVKSGWSLVCSQSAVGNQSSTLALKVTAFGADY